MKKFGYEEGSEERVAGERRILAEEVQGHREKLLTLEAKY